MKQGCVLAHKLFAIVFSPMLRMGKEELTKGIYIRFQTDGSIFNLRHLLARTKTIEELIFELLFDDDCAILAHTGDALRIVVDHFAKSVQAFGMTMNLKKTVVLYQNFPRAVYSSPQGTSNSHPLNMVELFSYLGSVISNVATTPKNVDPRLARASSSFSRLQHRVS